MIEDHENLKILNRTVKEFHHTVSNRKEGRLG